MSSKRSRPTTPAKPKKLTASGKLPKPPRRKPATRGSVFGDKRTKRLRTRQTKDRAALED